MDDDGGRIISPAVEAQIRQFLQTEPTWHQFFGGKTPHVPPTRRQRLRMKWWDLRYRLADLVGGGDLYRGDDRY